MAHLPGLVCAGCGLAAAEDSALPFRCAAARPGDDIDHVVARVGLPADAVWPDDDHPNPFVRFRTLMHAWQLGRARGLGDSAYIALVEELDAAVARVDGAGFVVTPLIESPGLGQALGVERGALFIKDETQNVARSHKARHLMGVAIYLAVVERTSPGLSRALGAAELAVASCGNAALAAAVVARAAGRRLRVFIPTWADADIARRLEALGATIQVCERRADDVPGDPSYLRFREAVARGAVPFSCQGNENGLTIDGGMTLGFELAQALGRTRIDRLFIQVGGGALASACAQGLFMARALGALAQMPALYPVQTRGVAPLRRAWRQVIDRASERARADHEPALSSDAARAAWCAGDAARLAVARELERAARRRSDYMWPVEAPATSVATGILDDETYDWLAILRALSDAGGMPLVVDEARLVEANELARRVTGIQVSATGSAGLAGALEAAPSFSDHENLAVLFTGGIR